VDHLHELVTPRDAGTGRGDIAVDADELVTVFSAPGTDGGFLLLDGEILIFSA